MWQYTQIIYQVRAIIDHYSKGNWFFVGENLGLIIHTVFGVRPRLDQESEGLIPSTSNGNDLFRGFAFGLNPEVYHYERQCISDLSSEVTEKLAENLKDIDWTHTEEAVVEVEDIIKVFKSAISGCDKGGITFKNFQVEYENAVEQTNFSESALGLMKSSPELLERVEKIQEILKDDAYFYAGEEIGELAKEVLKLKIYPKTREEQMEML